MFSDTHRDEEKASIPTTATNTHNTHLKIFFTLKRNFFSIMSDDDLSRKELWTDKEGLGICTARLLPLLTNQIT